MSELTKDEKIVLKSLRHSCVNSGGCQYCCFAHGDGKRFCVANIKQEELYKAVSYRSDYFKKPKQNTE